MLQLTAITRLPYRPTMNNRVTILSLCALLATAGCGMFLPDPVVIHDSPHAFVSLVRLSTRGASGRFPGAVKSFNASHPAMLPSNKVAGVLTGIYAGIVPPDRPDDPTGIKPTPLFSPQAIAALAPAIASALKRAEPDQRIFFRVGSEPEVTEGTLFIDGTAVRFTLERYRATTQRPDPNLSIYRLSYRPESAQVAPSGPQAWMEIEPNHPRLSISYDRVTAVPELSPAPRIEPSASSSQTSHEQGKAMQQQLEHQSRELERLQKELDSLKKQMGTPPPKTTP